MDEGEHFVRVGRVDDAGTPAQLLDELEVKLEDLINGRRHYYERMRETVVQYRGAIDSTAEHLENMKKSFLHVKNVPVDNLFLHYNQEDVKEDRRMLKIAVETISNIGLDNPDLSPEWKREMDRKLREEDEFKDFITRAERGLDDFREICLNTDNHIDHDLAEVERDGRLLRGMLSGMRSNVFEDYSTTDKFQHLLSLAAISVTCFVMYWTP